MFSVSSDRAALQLVPVPGCLIEQKQPCTCWSHCQQRGESSSMSETWMSLYKHWFVETQESMQHQLLAGCQDAADCIQAVDEGNSFWETIFTFSMGSFMLGLLVRCVAAHLQFVGSGVGVWSNYPTSWTLQSPQLPQSLLNKSRQNKQFLFSNPKPLCCPLWHNV